MSQYLVYNMSGELDDISHLFPNERLGRTAAIVADEGNEVEVIDRANLADLQRIGPEFLKQLGGLAFSDTTDSYVAMVETEARTLLDTGCETVFLNLWHGSGFKFSVDLARAIRRLDDGVRVIGIGQKVDWFKEHILRLTGEGIDGLLTGLAYDGVRHLVRGGAPEDCPGAIWKTDQGVHVVPRQVVNVDDYPLATYSPDVYRNISAKVPLATVMLSNQACPNRCAYCIRPENYGRKQVERDLDTVMAELLALYSGAGIRHFRIEDSTPPRLALTELARRVLDSELAGDVQFSAFSRIDTNCQEDFALMRQAGFRSLFFGIETLDAGMLTSVGKGITVAGIRTTLRAAHDAGIATVGSFIFPLPGETRESMDATFRELRAIRPWLDSLVVLPAGVYPPTEWGEHPEQYGIKLDDDYYEKFVAYPLKYLLPIEHWPPVPFKYSAMGKNVDEIDFALILQLYGEFLAVARKELHIPPVPDYYVLLADLIGQPPMPATQRLVELMIARDYAGIAAMFRAP